jgi:hypothetical protein
MYLRISRRTLDSSERGTPSPFIDRRAREQAAPVQPQLCIIDTAAARPALRAFYTSISCRVLLGRGLEAALEDLVQPAPDGGGPLGGVEADPDTCEHSSNEWRAGWGKLTLFLVVLGHGPGLGVVRRQALAQRRHIVVRARDLHGDFKGSWVQPEGPRTSGSPVRSSVMSFLGGLNSRW